MSAEKSTRPWSRIKMSDGYRLMPKDAVRRMVQVCRGARTDDDCWLWSRGVSAENRYGKLRIQIGKRRWKLTPSRASYVAHFGEMQDETLIVRHSCDNPPCVNPAHLSLGTHKDNRHDAMTRGRIGRKGRKVTQAITIVGVRQLFSEGLSRKQIARTMNLSETTVRSIVSGALRPSLQPTDLP